MVRLSRTRAFYGGLASRLRKIIMVLLSAAGQDKFD